MRPLCSLVVATVMAVTDDRGGNDKNTKINFFAFWWFYNLGSLGIYFDKMDLKFKKKIDQKCSIGGADGNFTGFC